MDRKDQIGEVMNAQLIISYATKVCLIVLPMLVTLGLLTQEQVDAIIALVNKLPEAVVWVLNLIAFAGSVVAMFRTWENYGKK